MKVVVRELFLARTVRERWLIGVMLAIAAVLLAWLLVVVPVSRAYGSALQRHLLAVDRHGRVAALVEQARAARGQATATAPGGDLVLLLGESARSAGVVLDRNSPVGPDGADVALAGAAPSAALAWLNALERRGYRIEQMRVAPAADGSVGVTARVTRTRP